MVLSKKNVLKDGYEIIKRVLQKGGVMQCHYTKARFFKL